MHRFSALAVVAGCGLLLQAAIPNDRTFAVAPRGGLLADHLPVEGSLPETGSQASAAQPEVSASQMAVGAVAAAALAAASLRLGSSGLRTRREGSLCQPLQQSLKQRAVPVRSSVPRAADAQAEPILKLGTRGSPLALAQAYETKRRLGEAFPELAEEGAVEIRTISTTGDQRLEIALSEIGGKGLFTRELDVALVNKEVDFCVHSTKDVPTTLVPGTELCTMLPREDTRDVLISPAGITTLRDLPEGSVIGTASLRRQAQIYALNSGVKCVNFRGNVQTRLRKLKSGEVDATLLAYAGLKRMNMEEHATSVLEWEEMLPAISQGAISFQCSSDDERVLKYLRPLSHEPTMQAVTCERAFLAALDGNCKTPIAGQARVMEDGNLRLLGLVSSPDGKKVYRVERNGAVADAEAIGRDAGAEVRAEAGEKFFEDMQAYVQDMQAANSKPTKAAA